MTDQFDEALAAYRSAIDSAPTFVDAYYNLADTYLNREMYPEAVQYYEAALEIEEGDADADIYFNAGLAYEKNGQFLPAIQAYEKGLSLDDSDAEAYYRLAQTYKKNGDTLMMRPLSRNVFGAGRAGCRILKNRSARRSSCLTGSTLSQD